MIDLLNNKRRTPQQPPSMVSYMICGWAACYGAILLLISIYEEFEHFPDPFNKETFCIYGFLSLAPGCIIGLMIYQQKRKEFDKSVEDKANHSIPQSVSQPTKICPFCGETVLSTAKKCKHCHEFLPAESKEGMKICPICGEDIPENSDVCPVCNELINFKSKS